jgi:hypothetical protein
MDQSIYKTLEVLEKAQKEFETMELANVPVKPLYDIVQVKIDAIKASLIDKGHKVTYEDTFQFLEAMPLQKHFQLVCEAVAKELLPDAVDFELAAITINKAMESKSATKAEKVTENNEAAKPAKEVKS